MDKDAVWVFVELDAYQCWNINITKEPVHHIAVDNTLGTCIKK